MDDISSYGPETITISNLTAGTYRYSVHNYSNQNSTTSRALIESGATVRVYRGSTEVGTYTVPTHRPPPADTPWESGTLWTVFTIDGATGAITPVNTLSNVAEPNQVQSVSRSIADGSESPALFQRLPEKGRN